MAISKAKKTELVAELNELLSSAKMTVFARFEGVDVAGMQVLRRAARESGVKIKVVKNRLVGKAIDDIEVYKNLDKSALTGQLLYAISSEDEVAPAQVLAKFAKDHPELVLIGGFSGEGANLSEEEVKSLALLPSKDQLIAEVVATLLSGVDGSLNAINGLPGLISALENKVE